MLSEDSNIMTTDEIQPKAPPIDQMIEQLRKSLKSTMDHIKKYEYGEDYFEKHPMNTLFCTEHDSDFGEQNRTIKITVCHATDGSICQIIKNPDKPDIGSDLGIYIKNITVSTPYALGIEIKFEYKNGEWIDVSTGPEGSKSWNGVGQSGGMLKYSSMEIQNRMDFEGNRKFDAVVNQACSIIEGEFPKINKASKRKNFNPCWDTKENRFFVYVPWKAQDISGEPDFKELCVVANETDYGFQKADVYLGDGNKNWRRKQLNAPFSLGFNTTTPPDGKKIYTNGTRLGWLMGQRQPDLRKHLMEIEHPRDVPNGYMCDGTPWPPAGTPEPEKPGEGKLPTGHKYYIKCIEGSLQTCWTFDGFQSRDGHYNITASNGRCLKYIHDQGCWQFFMSLPKAVELGTKYKLKDIVTNSKEAHEFFLKNVGKYEGKLILNENPVDISPYYWQNSKHLYFASWTAKEAVEKPQQQTWHLAVFNFADGNTLRNPDGSTSTPIIAHFESGKIYDLKAPWEDWHNWVPDGDYPTYSFDRLPKYNNFQTNHRVLWGWMERHGKIAGNHSKFISPCTNPLPDGSLPPGVIGPPRPPKPQPPGDAGKDPIGPKPIQPGDDGPISIDSIPSCSGDLDDVGTRVNQRLNGLYYYYLEESLFYGTPNKDNTSILGTTSAIANVAYAPFLNIRNTDLCKVDFDVKRFGEVEGKGTPMVFRIRSGKPAPMDIAKWNVYPKSRVPNSVPKQPWRSQYESRLLDYPYRKVAFFSNIFDMYDVIPHLHYQASGELEMTLKACCPVTPGGNFYLYVDNYKGDKSGFTERQFTSTSMDIPNTSSAYSTYMATQKSQAANQIGIQPLLKTTGTIGGAALGAVVGSVVPGAGTAIGAAAGAVLGGGISMAGAVMDNMAKRADLMTTPKSLSSMGGDVIARLGDATHATVVACDMEITDAYKDLLARYFHMYGTKQNRVLDVDSNINSRYYFNYIQTVGCNVSANGVPKRHIAKIKAVMDRGTTFWHLDRSGVTFGEYCVYDNVEVN